MEELFQRFPDLVLGILDQLDDQNLVKSKEVAITWCSFISEEKILWIRMIQKYGHENIKEDPDTWRNVMFKTPTEIVKKLALALQLFFNRYGATNGSPFHFAAHSGDLQLCLQIFEKLKLKEPGYNYGCTPIHYAAMGGILKFTSIL